MKGTVALLAVIALCAVRPAYADYSVSDKGEWPNSWPKELEQLRKQSRTFEGPLTPLMHYAIPFTKRAELESAWPHLLKVKSQGAPIILRRGTSFWFGTTTTAGVCVHTPPVDVERRSIPESPIAGVKNAGGHGETTIYIELVVDGEIVDLNRIPLPRDTPIIDERFKGGITK